MAITLDQLKGAVFAGESGGDYNALYGYANRPNGRFADTRLTDMTVNQALEFSDPSGPYAQSVKAQIGRVATPMGAYQVVGSTLRDAARGLGLTGNERMTQDLQDKIGMWIYQNQGPSAWEAWGKGGGSNSSLNLSTRGGAMPMGLLDDEPQTFGQRLKRDFQSGELMDRVALAANSLRLRPDDNLAQVVQGRQEARADRNTLNRTAQWLASRGRDDLAQAMMTGALDPKTAVATAMQPVDPLAAIQLETAQINLERLKSGADSDPNVQSSALLPDQSGVVVTMRDGSVRVRRIGGQELSGQEAEDFVRQAQENYASLQGDIYDQRRRGTLGANIDLGGEAARVAELGRMAPEIAEDYYRRANLVQSSIGNMASAIQAIDEGAQSGIIYDMLPNVTVASAELQNARQRLGLDVIGSVTFGALSEAEMLLAMDTAVPRGLVPAELRIWLDRKRAAQEKALIALQEAALHFAEGGTRAEYLRKIGWGAGSPAQGAGAPPQGQVSPPQGQGANGVTVGEPF
jgi:hypothetical protein